MKKALIFQGGWQGHEPKLVSQRFKTVLEENGFQAIITDTLETLDDETLVMEQDLLIPCWTMSSISAGQVENVSKAVAAGTGLAGCHGGMCDAFRDNVLWQFITGGQWVSHPGDDGVPYMVNIKNSSSPITQDIKDFQVISEHYYLHIDPAIEVLATTTFPVVNWHHASNGVVEMPVAWTKRWGHGHVFYTSLGHHNDIFDVKEAMQLMTNGMLWAAQGKEKAFVSS